MTLDEKVGQLIFSSINAAYLSTDSDEFERLRHLVRDLKVGGFHVFGSAEAFPQVMLNPVWGGGNAMRKGEPYSAALLLNRLQSESAIPLLTSGDFEGGAAYILNGATRLPRAMVIGATGDDQMAFKAGVVGATEARAIGVNIDFYPVVDVNNNPRNPVINLRSFGEDPALVSKMAVAYIKGIQSTGAFATAKHFPGHGDTNVDTHLGLAVINHPRERLDKVELVPFKAAIAAGVDAVMSSHIVLPALDPAPGIPATLSRPILTGILRNELKFGGLIFTDSMTMDAISKMFTHDRAAAEAVKAGVDFVLHSPDDDAAFKGIKAAVACGGDQRGAAQRVGRAHPAGEGAARAARESAGGPRGDCGEVRQPRPRAGRAGDQRQGNHAHQGRAQPGAADSPARRERALPVGARLRVGLARRRAEPDADPRTEEAVAEPDGDRGDGPNRPPRSTS